MKLLIPLLFVSSSLFGQTLYDGETFPFSQGVTFDGNGSKIEESTATPFTPPKHLRAMIKNVNWWGATGYVFDNYRTIDFTNHILLSFQMRSSQKGILLGVQLHDEAGKNSNFLRVETDYNYQEINLPIDMFTGVDLSRITSVIFSVSRSGTNSQVVDVDNIELFGRKESPKIEGVMRTDGTNLFDACGKKIVLRGVNHMTCYTDWIGTPRDGLPMFEEIAKTGANSVRIVWTHKDGTKPSELDAAIGNAAKHRLIPMVELLDRTCDWGREAFDEILNYWLKPEVLAILKKHQKYLLLNFANEMGNDKTNLDNYKSEYKRVIEKLREAGIKSPIVIDAPGCGQNETIMLQAANYLINSDPLHNIVMSLHLWWVPQDEKRITNLITESKRLNIPLILGEFSGLAVDCKTPTLIKHILKLSQEHGIGWLPWSWDSANGCKAHAMTTDNTFNGLFGYGKEVALTEQYSIKNTSVISQCF